MAIMWKQFAEVAPKALVEEILVQTTPTAAPIADTSPVEVDALERAAMKFPAGSIEQRYATRILGRLKHLTPTSVGRDTLVATITTAPAEPEVFVGATGWAPGNYTVSAEWQSMRYGASPPFGPTPINISIDASGNMHVQAPALSIQSCQLRGHSGLVLWSKTEPSWNIRISYQEKERTLCIKKWNPWGFASEEVQTTLPLLAPPKDS